MIKSVKYKAFEIFEIGSLLTVNDLFQNRLNAVIRVYLCILCLSNKVQIQGVRKIQTAVYWSI